MKTKMTELAVSALMAMFATTLQVHSGDAGKQALASPAAGGLLGQSLEAYTILERTALSRELASIGVSALPQLGAALGNEHWHVRHCALMALREIAADASNRAALEPLVPALGKLVTGDPHHGVRVEAAACLGAMAERGKGGQLALAKAAVGDEEPWVRTAAANALAAVGADLPVMMPVYKSMIQSTDKASRADGIREAGRLFEKKVDIAPLVPALMDVFRKPLYDANFSSQTRNPAIDLLLKLKVDTSELVPFFLQDLATTGQVQADGYHPYQRMTLKLLGRMGAAAVAAIPTLEQVIADPSKFGCDRRHPDYPGFKSDAQKSIQQIRAAAQP